MDLENMQCRTCLKKYLNRHLLAQHMNEHFINYTCEKCGKGFATRRRYTQHTRMHKYGVYRCKDCDKTFDTIIKLQNHRGKHVLERYVCRRCSRRFQSFYQRQKHMRDEHGSTVNYPCDRCESVCLTAASLAAHVRQKHMARQRLHSCNLCEKEFYTSNSLKRHMIVHTGQRIHKCDFCGKAYARTNTLVQHMKIHKDTKDLGGRSVVRISFRNAHLDTT